MNACTVNIINIAYPKFLVAQNYIKNTLESYRDFDVNFLALCISNRYFLCKI